MPTWDSLWTNVNLATMAAGGAPYGAIENGALAIKDGRIAWVGAASELPHRDAGEVVDGGGGWLTPGLIDCHTHLVFAGDRSGEFEQRLQGVSYEEIARAGGGIARTVAATRQASRAELADAAARRLACLLAEGVTTIEIKSGYGLDRATEIKMLEVARGLGSSHPVDVRTTFLGAHALPGEFADDRAGYLDLVCTQVLPEVAERGLADAVDAFCEGIAFTPDEVARVFQAARALGLPVKLHADQLSDLGGGALAARFGALSADHLEYAGEDGIRAMAAAGTVAVLLPGAFYTLRERQKPPGRPAPPARRADRARHRLQSRLLAHRLDPRHPQHGVHPVRADARGGAGGGHPPCRPRARAGRSRHARGGQARRSRPLGDPSPG